MRASPASGVLQGMQAEPPSASDVFRRHHLAVWRFLRRQTGQAAEADELAQETFLRVARSLSSYRDRGSERAWVFRIARNVLANHWRDRSRHPTDAREPAEHDRAASPVEGLRLVLDEALSALAPLDRETFLLREVGGLGYDEIAAACDLTPAAVRNRIHRARSALRDALAPQSGRRDLHEA